MTTYIASIKFVANSEEKAQVIAGTISIALKDAKDEVGVEDVQIALTKVQEAPEVADE